MNKKELTEIVRNQDKLLEEHCAYLANINRAMGRYRNEGASLLDATKKIIAKLEAAEKKIADAPHAFGCGAAMSILEPCTCWKSKERG